MRRMWLGREIDVVGNLAFLPSIRRRFKPETTFILSYLKLSTVPLMMTFKINIHAFSRRVGLLLADCSTLQQSQLFMFIYVGLRTFKKLGFENKINFADFIKKILGFLKCSQI